MLLTLVPARPDLHHPILQSAQQQREQFLPVRPDMVPQYVVPQPLDLQVRGDNLLPNPSWSTLQTIYQTCT